MPFPNKCTCACVHAQACAGHVTGRSAQHACKSQHCAHMPQHTARAWRTRGVQAMLRDPGASTAQARHLGALPCDLSIEARDSRTAADVVLQILSYRCGCGAADPVLQVSGLVCVQSRGMADAGNTQLQGGLGVVACLLDLEAVTRLDGWAVLADDLSVW